MSDDNVTPFPIKPKLDSGRVLEVVPEWQIGKCRHTKFRIDKALAQVTCRDCGEKVDPMHALVTLATAESKYHDLHSRYADEMNRLGKREKTKCQHCQKMTRISNK
jgi:ribosomal protein S27E